MDERIIGCVDAVRQNEVSGWASLKSDLAAERLCLAINGQKTDHRAEIFPREDLERKGIIGDGFRFRPQLEVGDYVNILDQRSGAIVLGGARVVAPSPMPSFELMLFCIMKSEEAYLLEWVAHHKLQGFRIVIADNSSQHDDEQSVLLKKLRDKGEIVYVDAVGKDYAQMGFYESMLKDHAGNDCILGFIDCDEFLVSLDGRQNAGAAIAEYFADPAVSAVALNWACFGSSGHVKKTDGLVVERFTRRGVAEFSANRHVKTFVRGGRAEAFSGNPHSVRLASGNYLQSDYARVVWAGQTRGISVQVKWNSVRVNHYIIKSHEEYVHIKGKRGSAISAENTQIKRREEYFKLYDQNEVEDTVLSKQTKELKAEIKRLAE